MVAKRTYKQLTPVAVSIARVKTLVSMEVSKDQPNENWQRLFIQSLLGSQPHHLPFDRDSKAGRGVGMIYSRKRESFSCALTGGCCHGEDTCRQPNQKYTWLVKCAQPQLVSLDVSKLETWTKIMEVVSYLLSPGHFSAHLYRGYYGFLSWFPEIVVWLPKSLTCR